MRFRSVLVCLAVPVAFGQGAFTLEQVMSSAFPSDLTAAPKDNRVAWVLNQKGTRNIWIAEGQGFEARQITRYAKDDGQEITGLAWTSNAKGVVYTRGGEPNRAGEIPNPTSDGKGAEQAVWVQSIDGGEPRKLGAGSDPAVSSQAGRVVWVHKGQVWSALLEGEAKAAQLFEGRGKASGLSWSPDGSKLAFVSGRGDHSFIGVYDFAAQSLRYVDPSTDRDGVPCWAPDGRHIAFVRVPSERQILPFGPQRSARPWSIRVADVADGSAREVFRASEGIGSVFAGEYVRANPLVWTATGHIVFPWEKTGWQLLYSVPASGGEPHLLTPGAFEAESLFVSRDTGNVVFTSNQDDTERRHIWSVSADGGAPKAWTKGKGIEWSPVLLSDGQTLACFRSDARTPAHASVRMASGEWKDLAPAAIPSDFPSASLVEPQTVSFSATDGMMISGHLFLPPKSQKGEAHPAVLFFHGGSRRQMLLGFHYRAYYHNAYALNQYLASQGYVVLSVNYRSGIGYGMEFREALNYGATGASEFQDVVGAGLYLRGRPDVDPKRIGLWGGSYGGFLTAMGLARASNLFAAGVDVHGVHDWNTEIHNFVPNYDPNEPQLAAFTRKAWESSPLASVDGWRSPVLLIHGDDDRNVNFSETVRLAEQLRKRNVYFEELIFPDEIHDFLLASSWLRAYRAAADFLDRKLAHAQ
jgi:dipeptidyl aminopeptidase/acylaminoacyl peptidase